MWTRNSDYLLLDYTAALSLSLSLGGLHSARSPTVGMLDLGGGSTQITFSPQDKVRTTNIDDTNREGERREVE